MRRGGGGRRCWCFAADWARHHMGDPAPLLRPLDLPPSPPNLWHHVPEALRSEQGRNGFERARRGLHKPIDERQGQSASRTPLVISPGRNQGSWIRPGAATAQEIQRVQDVRRKSGCAGRRGRTRLRGACRNREFSGKSEFPGRWPVRSAPDGSPSAMALQDDQAQVAGSARRELRRAHQGISIRRSVPVPAGLSPKA